MSLHKIPHMIVVRICASLIEKSHSVRVFLHKCHPCQIILSCSSFFFFIMNCLVFSLILFFISFSIEQQVVFDTNINYGWLTPFTYEWVTVLDRLHNTFGNRSKTEQCLHKIPKFECERFVWDDSIIHRDAYHLRPNVK